MAGFHNIGSLEQFREGRGRAVTVEGRTLAVFRSGGTVFAVSDACPHMGASLSMGRIVDGKIECAWHHWRFDLVTGRNAFKPWACVTVCEVRVEGNDVLVRIPEEPAGDPEPRPDEGRDDDDWFVFDPEREDS